MHVHVLVAILHFIIILDWTPPVSTDGITEETVLRMIQEALYNYSADQIAKFDFALESAGGHVVDSSDTFDPANTKAQLFGFTLPITITRNFVGVIIQVHILTCIAQFMSGYHFIILFIACSITG